MTLTFRASWSCGWRSAGRVFPAAGTACAEADRGQRVAGGGKCSIGNAKVKVSWTRFQRALNATLLGIQMLQGDSEQEREVVIGFDH